MESCSATKQRGELGGLAIILLGNWLAISLSMGGNELQPLHHLFYFFSFSLFPLVHLFEKKYLTQSPGFLAFTLFHHPIKVEGWDKVSE